jgi:hypothetical protein
MPERRVPAAPFDRGWTFFIGLLLCTIQGLGVLAWLVWAAYQLTLPAEKSLNNPNSTQALTSMYPFVGSFITMVPILEEIYYNCVDGTCSTRHKLVWFIAPCVSTLVYFILFGANYKLYPDDRGAVVVMGWNACSLATTTIWTGFAFWYVQDNKKVGDVSGEKPQVKVEVQPLAINWNEPTREFGAMRRSSLHL